MLKKKYVNTSIFVLFGSMITVPFLNILLVHTRICAHYHGSPEMPGRPGNQTSYGHVIIYQLIYNMVMTK